MARISKGRDTEYIEEGREIIQHSMRPEWLKIKLPAGKLFHAMKHILRTNRLHTVCEEALCPNIGECFEQRTATFLILGNVCTRNCGFCAIKKGYPQGIDEGEPFRIAGAVKKLGLQHAVITSVTRDDLADGGASVYARIIALIREYSTDCTIEVLIPDFRGSVEALEIIIEASPDIINHNIETVPRLYPKVRPEADFRRSMELLKTVKQRNPSITTKSGLMLGLGEERSEIIDTLLSMRNIRCDILTLGQYLSPTKKSLPVARYYTPYEFKELKEKGMEMGFLHIESGPLVRSSYHAVGKIINGS